MIVLAHVSDVHIDGSDRNTERTTRIMSYVEGLDVTAVLVTGDIADNGAEDEYTIAQAALKTRHPSIICPGNHDIRAPFRKVLLDSSPGPSSPVTLSDDVPDAPVNQVLRVPGATIILCDSSIPGRPDGRLDDATLAWLDATLTTETGPVFVGMHHPPTPLGIPYVDGIGLQEPENLAAILERHPHVVATLVGHAHTAAATTFANRPLLVAPGVVSTALPPFESTTRPPVDYDLPPAFALHIFDNGHLTTHYRALP
ncbi:3',5'-cyclic adenosine monophosphate phosphodiesterase CpdA [Acrocarpospora phusangensis]|uniref:3',5'-cyclic adenosine monophosphate phosphodiesterase CpdA n=1 Tax=Acrocarpospora phusangensis TaxID=1070424 RepID=A0A919QKA7_9ACTN|nr:metallophosphoesterase [Acrocarpospora phusangensis]GIH29248.1 3',5'-cyclic adenosine monophosphate phosphodiesterase CpdA [Acrocarpospora phusangensis]